MTQSGVATERQAFLLTASKCMITHIYLYIMSVLVWGGDLCRITISEVVFLLVAQGSRAGHLQRVNLRQEALTEKKVLIRMCVNRRMKHVEYKSPL